MEQTTFLSILAILAPSLDVCESNKTPKPRRPHRPNTQAEFFELLGMPSTTAEARMENLMRRIQRREQRKLSENHVIRQDRTEWVISRDGAAVSVSMAHDGFPEQVFTKNFDSAHLAVGFVALAKKRIESGEGFDEIPEYTEQRPNATGGFRYAFYGIPVRSEDEAQALIDGIGEDSLATMRRSVVSRYQHCLEPEEIENVFEISLHNAALTFEAQKTTTKTEDGKPRALRAYVAMCANNRCRKLVELAVTRSKRMPTHSLDAVAYAGADCDAATGLDFIASDELTPGEICEQNEFRDMRGFARGEGDWILILLVLSGAWVVPLSETVGRKFRGLVGSFSRIFQPATQN